MKTIVNELRLTFSETDQPLLYLPLNMSRREAVAATEPLKELCAKGKRLSVQISQHRQKRSLDANGFMWLVLQKIAEAVGNTKEEIYKKIIRDVGQFEILPIREEAVEHWIAVWNGRGLGWYAEVVDDSKLPGYKKVINYYGSSVYDSKAMSILIDEVISEAKEIGIDLITEAEKDLLIKDWGGSK